MVKKQSPFQTSTLNEKEVDQFDQIAALWWDEKGPFKPLHLLNPCRLKFVIDHLRNAFSLSFLDPEPLKGLKILDVGCGGGILCEPLTRLGAKVTGIDASPKAIMVAKEHAMKNELEIDYHCTTIESFREQDFDAIMALEIIEHVDSPGEFIKSCAKNLKKEGLFFISTLNQTWRSYLEAIIGAEYILGWVPRGTHDWKKFIPPSELAALLRECSMQFIDLKGIRYKPFTGQWTLENLLNVNYIGCSVLT
ncbi:MAG: bifunctional 2-polyprenyl-6-hydroxyphenol methylase/3-demethylubiquinol 3-O-methyltransferase UbiG [Alphaproteobacteria bacterium]|nr:bifunctional 2-polyprenyl-6-hydroxyphenol methylase/3-demethylubiquinol 3-O-methyltransferase UbiG [Alphaproteobacteria bacterium]